MKRLIRLIAAAAAAFSCQKETIQVEIEEELYPLGAVVFHVDTLIYGEDVRITADYAEIPAEPLHMDFITIDGKRVLFTHTLQPDTLSMADTLTLKPSTTLKPGFHRLEFNLCHMDRHVNCQMPFAVCPVSTEFLSEGGLYLYDGTYYSGYSKICIPEGETLDLELGNVRKIVLLTGLTNAQKDPHGLYADAFDVSISQEDKVIDFEGTSVSNLKYYFHNPSTDKGECMAIFLSFYPLALGEAQVAVDFWGERRIIDVRVTGPKDKVKL